MAFKGILIDLGDTLAHFDEAKSKEYQAALASTLKNHGRARSPTDLVAALASLYHASTKGELNTPREFWSRLLQQLQILEQPELVEALEEVRNKQGSDLLSLYDKVPETLAALKAKYQLALVSNCTPGTDKAIRLLGLNPYFTCIILSYQLGVRKPDTRMYRAALDCLGLDAEDCAFVADEVSDLEGARAVGLTTVLVQQGSSPLQDAVDPEFQPDFQIGRISEITNVL